MKRTAKNTALTAVFAAVIFMATAFLHISVGNGYVHLGDSFIYLGAALLPSAKSGMRIFKPSAMLAAGIGGALADIFAGYMIYVPATFVIKMLLTLAFDPSRDKTVSARNIIACIVAVLVTVGGYFLYEAVIYGVAAALVSVWANLMQAVSSGVLFVVIGAVLDRFGFKERLSRL